VKSNPRKQLSPKDFAREEERIVRMLEEIDLFESDAEADREWRLRECEHDFDLFQRTYVQHYLAVAKDAPMHAQMIEACQTVEVPVELIAPRGFAKSTKVSFIFILWCILYRKKHFIVLAMESWDKAQMQTWRILLELKFNQRIIHDFGVIVREDAARGDFTTTTGVRLVALGAGMSARGLVNGPHRPDLFICDDLESRALARNPRRVDILTDILLADYLPSMCAQGWTFVVIGTIICKKSMLDKLKSNDSFRVLFFQAEVTLPDGRRDSAWPEMISYEKLQLLRKIIGESRYLAEKMNTPIETEGAFNERWFKHYKTLPPDIDHKQTALVQDPSYSATGDNKATFAINLYKHTLDKRPWYDVHGVPFPEGEYIVVCDARNRKETIDQMIIATYEMHRKWKCDIYVDGSVNQKVTFGREYAHYEAKEKFGRLPIKFIQLVDDKDSRIASLESPISRGFMVFPPRTNPDVEETINQFVKHGEPGVAKDGPDALAFGKQILEKKIKKKARVHI
jgi:hypothetical protein